jgi:branched-chain amino acid transport system ATP-binding protein
MSARLAVRGITMRFGGVVALEDISFEAQSGRVLGIMGPNGAGKTTLFNVISGVQKPTRGTVVLDETLLTGHGVAWIAGRGVTRTFQTPMMFWGLDVRESIAAALAAREFGGIFPPAALRSLVPSGFGWPARRAADAALRERAGALLESMGIAALAERPTETLSFGEERFLELARALAIEPKMLLLDEPLSGLNPDEVELVLQTIVRARDAGIGVLLVEHAVGELLSVADRVVVLDHGRKIAEGAAREVAADPAVIDAYIGDELG